MEFLVEHGWTIFWLFVVVGVLVFALNGGGSGRSRRSSGGGGFFDFDDSGGGDFDD